MPMVSNLRIDVQRLPFTGDQWVELIFRVEVGGTVHVYRQNVEVDHFDSLFNLIFDQAKQALAIAARTNQRANTVRREPDPQVAPYDYAAVQRELERHPQPLRFDEHRTAAEANQTMAQYMANQFNDLFPVGAPQPAPLPEQPPATEEANVPL